MSICHFPAVLWGCVLTTSLQHPSRWSHRRACQLCSCITLVRCPSVSVLRTQFTVSRLTSRLTLLSSSSRRQIASPSFGVCLLLRPRFPLEFGVSDCITLARCPSVRAMRVPPPVDVRTFTAPRHPAICVEMRNNVSAGPHLDTLASLLS